jgi:2-polyprenyl-6-hydroxyphenyl methylase/3-demethylubiquinone-9 3-methyltransferase
VFVYDTVNRTWRSWLVMVYLLQDLSWTRLASERPHDWRLFVRPGELHRALARHGLSNQETVGMGPSASLPRLLGLLRRCKLGEITPAEALRLSAVRLGPDTSVSYLGYALKDHTAR